ncbi:MAG TPA: beta-galactosidase [Terriglobia bacterium]|nr:beta-galactosidase [Terriglobia bacterium]
MADLLGKHLGTETRSRDEDTGKSRRGFLQSMISAPLVAGLGSRLGSLRALLSARARDPESAGPAGLAASAAQFPQPGFIRYDSHCFTVNDRDTFLYGAAFHYPRCPRELWSDRLLKLKAAGFNVIETYVFWDYHEPEQGRCDLSEFEEFVKLVGSMGFLMIVRPGPYVCAEWDTGGFPRWVARQGFPLRSNHPKSISTSQHWFSQVLPVIVRHQVTHRGPIILMQVENEYDYWKLADSAKRDYVRALAHMAWDAGVDVPLITCWTQQVRDRKDPDFSRMVDTCNFYPRWNVTREVLPALAKLRREQSDAPVGVTELQGGWFSEFGGKLSVDQEGVNGRQLNLLSKTAIEQGVAYFNYYMGFGGTNFDWAAKNLTTTYDYAAPLREPGGLWEKYYAARGVGASLRLLGRVLTRAEGVPDAAGSTNPQVSVSLRASGKSGAVFIRENGNAVQRYKASFQDPNSPTHRLIAVPREGELELGPREMKMLPVQIPIGDTVLRYSTAEVLAYLEGSRPYLVVYDEPGRLAELSFATENEPHVEGDAVYQYWDREYESLVMGVRVEQRKKMLMVNAHLQLVVLPRERALKSWAPEWPAGVFPGGPALPEDEQRNPVAVPFFTDAALLVGNGRSKKTLWADFDFASGEHQVDALVPPLPAKVWLNGVETPFEYDRHWETCRFKITTPKLALAPHLLEPAQIWVERFDPGAGEWLATGLRPLDDLGPLPYGYVKYRAEFAYHGEPRMFITAFAEDPKKVFLNSKLVPQASKPAINAEFALADYAHAGTNTLEVAFEQFGNPNFGPEMAEMRGLQAVRYGKDASSGTAIDPWQVQRFPAPMRGRRVDPAFAGIKWSSGLGSGHSATTSSATHGIVPAFTWCRAEFSLDDIPAGWFIPWKLTFEADRDALLYLNGSFLGRYAIAGPQKDFFVPDPYLTSGAKARNVVTVVLAYTDSPAVIRTLTVAPYGEFVTERVRVELQW